MCVAFRASINKPRQQTISSLKLFVCSVFNLEYIDFSDNLGVARIKRKVGNREGRRGCAENESDTMTREVNNAGLKIRRFRNMWSFRASERASASAESPSEKLLEDAGQFFRFSRRAA